MFNKKNVTTLAMLFFAVSADNVQAPNTVKQDVKKVKKFFGLQNPTRTEQFWNFFGFGEKKAPVDKFVDDAEKTLAKGIQAVEVGENMLEKSVETVGHLENKVNNVWARIKPIYQKALDNPRVTVGLIGAIAVFLGYRYLKQ